MIKSKYSPSSTRPAEDCRETEAASEPNQLMHSRISSIVADSIEVKRRYFAGHAQDITDAAGVIAESFRAGGKLLVCGNGGSAADAQHVAGEFVNQFLLKERRALPALALTTDGGVLTCVANDTGFERVFARQVEAFATRSEEHTSELHSNSF